MLPEHGIVHHEVALVVCGVEPGEIVVEASAGGDDDVDHVVLDHVDDDPAGSGGHDACREGEDLEAALLLDHLLGDVGRIGELLCGETSGFAHLGQEIVDGHSLGCFDVFHCDFLERLAFGFAFGCHFVTEFASPTTLIRVSRGRVPYMSIPTYPWR